MSTNILTSISQLKIHVLSSMYSIFARPPVAHQVATEAYKSGSRLRGFLLEKSGKGCVFASYSIAWSHFSTSASKSKRSIFPSTIFQICFRMDTAAGANDRLSRCSQPQKITPFQQNSQCDHPQQKVEFVNGLITVFLYRSVKIKLCLARMSYLYGYGWSIYPCD